MLTQPQIQQIIDALEKTDWVQWVRKRMVQPKPQPRRAPREYQAASSPRGSVAPNESAKEYHDLDDVQPAGVGGVPIGDVDVDYTWRPTAVEHGKYARSRRILHQYQRAVVEQTAHRASPQLRVDALQAADQANENYKAIAERVAKYAMAHNLDYDTAATRLNVPSPPPLLGSLA